MNDDVRFDWQRTERAGVPEVVFAQGKSTPQLLAIVSEAIARRACVLMTRLSTDQAQALIGEYPDHARFHEASGTLVAGTCQDSADKQQTSRVVKKLPSWQLVPLTMH